MTDSAARARARAAADRDLAARAQTTADAMDRTLQQRMVEVFTFAALPSLRGFAASDEAGRPARMAIANTELRAIVAADPNVRAATIVDALGVVTLTTDASMNADWSQRVFVREALAGRLHASPIVREFGEFSQFYSAPILDNAGEVAGALVVRVAAQEMWSALASDAMVVDENSVRIADRSDKPQILVALSPLMPDVFTRTIAEKRYGAEVTQIPATNLTDLANAVKRGNAAPLTFRDSQGRTLRAAMRQLKTNVWTVVAFANEDAILSPWRDALADQLKLVGVTALVLMGLLFAARRGKGQRSEAA